MGTGFELSGASSSQLQTNAGEQIGIIPRAVHQLFQVLYGWIGIIMIYLHI